MSHQVHLCTCSRCYFLRMGLVEDHYSTASYEVGATGFEYDLTGQWVAYHAMNLITQAETWGRIPLSEWNLNVRQYSKGA